MTVPIRLGPAGCGIPIRLRPASCGIPIRHRPAGCGRFHRVNRRSRTAATLTAVLTTLLALVLPAAALAADGVGTAGRVSDKYITFFCFGVIAFFAVLVTVLSLIQDRLEAKKDQRRYDLNRFNS